MGLVPLPPLSGDDLVKIKAIRRRYNEAMAVLDAIQSEPLFGMLRAHAFQEEQLEKALGMRAYREKLDAKRAEQRARAMLRKAVFGAEEALLKAYNPEQPRAPKGVSTGGQWIGSSALLADALTQCLSRYRVYPGSARIAENLGVQFAGVDVDEIMRQLEELGGGRPRFQPTPKGASQWVFPNRIIMRFDIESGQYLTGQKPHINLEIPAGADIGGGMRSKEFINFHINLD